MKKDRPDFTDPDVVIPEMLRVLKDTIIYHSIKKLKVASIGYDANKVVINTGNDFYETSVSKKLFDENNFELLKKRHFEFVFFIGFSSNLSLVQLTVYSDEYFFEEKLLSLVDITPEKFTTLSDEEKDDLCKNYPDIFSKRSYIYIIFEYFDKFVVYGVPVYEDNKSIMFGEIFDVAKHTHPDLKLFETVREKMFTNKHLIKKTIDEFLK